ncbi:phenylalanine--tRNA ligase subunit beta [Candidatus Williamhamiltonella defendens]|uniref:phenylalanine--tRNA ligase subunit beta n=1 Tax=Candidatus Williamhamiltonella defendens TaxID=138072 RepID=UPI0015838BD5|nr:phenylalanine--tRNA ligase subunit beta [Candidatus Hamiltonella defensa]
MKFSEFWLREWVQPEINTEILSEQLTMAGLEVETVEPAAPPFSGVLIGHVLECHPHPNADKLKVTKIHLGQDRLCDVVCGAQNCRQGLKVAIATIGAVLPGSFKIKKTKLRGVLSEGMLCAFDELGIPSDETGIIELPENAPIGMNFREWLHLDDNIFQINVTPNRADCLSILGVAREIATINRVPLLGPNINKVTEKIQEKRWIRVEAPEACPRYLGRVIKGICVKAKTPFWMQKKLERSGLRSIDPVVDVTNYVLLELGQPLHAFDLEKIKHEIIVRWAKEGEELTLLDGRALHLNPKTLVIADHTKVLALAGIFGGQNSGITQKTEHLFLESAFFHPTAIVAQARQYGLQTEAAHRYERGVDPQLQYKAIERATQLLIEICGGEVGPIIDVSSPAMLSKTQHITLRSTKLDRLLGYQIEFDQALDILQHLGFQIQEKEHTQGAYRLQLRPPSWRFDIALEEDVIEEIARIYGYHRIPETPIKSELSIGSSSQNECALTRFKTLLTYRGYQEAITYSFVDPKIQSLLHPDEDALFLPNPISADMSVMRLSLLTGLLCAVVYNQNRQQTTVRLFESGLRFIPDSSQPLGVKQEHVLSGMITGQRFPEHWDFSSQPLDFYDMKGDLEALLDLSGKLPVIQFKTEPHCALHPGQSAALYLNEEKIGWMGLIHPKCAQALTLKESPLVFEIQWRKLTDSVTPCVKKISRFPSNRRDIAIIVDEKIPAEEILKECRKVSVNQIVDINLFDLYQGEGVSKGYKSLAISLVLQDSERTLEEDEIAATVSTCVSALKKKFQASLR